MRVVVNTRTHSKIVQFAAYFSSNLKRKLNNITIYSCERTSIRNRCSIKKKKQRHILSNGRWKAVGRVLCQSAQIISHHNTFHTNSLWFMRKSVYLGTHNNNESTTALSMLLVMKTTKEKCWNIFLVGWFLTEWRNGMILKSIANDTAALGLVSF